MALHGYRFSKGVARARRALRRGRVVQAELRCGRSGESGGRECSLGLSLAGKTGTQRRILALEWGKAVMQWLDRLVFYTAG